MRIIGLDIGSTNIKGCVFDLADPARPKLLEQHSDDCPLKRPAAGLAEHDLSAAEDALRQILDKMPKDAPIGIDSAMHALVLLDSKDEPLGDAISWADTRSEEQATRLAGLDSSAHARTGTPVHAMAWPAKLLWLKESDPERWASVARVTDLKTFLLSRVLGEKLPLDLSNASATGLYNAHERAWDSALCERLELDLAWLPEVAPSQQRLEIHGRSLTLGTGDGPAGNLGVGAVTRQRLAISVGTSGAVRKAMARGEAAFRPELFIYSLLEDSVVQGGAISNGSSVLDWLGRLKDLDHPKLIACASSAPLGAHGIVVHPYFSGERAPFWRSDIKSEIRGYGMHHDFSDLARGCLEGVAYCLRRLILLLGQPAEPLRCTGGMFHNPFWCQLVADVSGCTVAVSEIGEATSLGAALLCLDDPLAVSEALPAGKLYDPAMKAQTAYNELYHEWAELDRGGSGLL